jgi:hypothetical protein
MIQYLSCSSKAFFQKRVEKDRIEATTAQVIDLLASAFLGEGSKKNFIQPLYTVWPDLYTFPHPGGSGFSDRRIKP